MRILIIEDEQAIGEHILTNLLECSFCCDWATTGKQALDYTSSEEYDCIILDRMLPDMDGLDVCQQIRENDLSVPILFLTALAGVDQRIKGLDSGGDDYLAKPFDMDELIARVNALIRRASFRQQPKIKIRDISLDVSRRQVEIDCSAISLSNREFRLLEYLMRNGGKPLTRGQILEHVWDNNMDVDSNMVDVYINYVRKKIDLKNGLASNIETVRGYGYRFRDDS